MIASCKAEWVKLQDLKNNAGITRKMGVRFLSC